MRKRREKKREREKRLADYMFISPRLYLLKLMRDCLNLNNSCVQNQTVFNQKKFEAVKLDF